LFINLNLKKYILRNVNSSVKTSDQGIETTHENNESEIEVKYIKNLNVFII